MKALTHLFIRPSYGVFCLLALLTLSGLLVTCSKQKPPHPLRPKASFRLENNNCTAPCDPGITNLSLYAQSYRWDFGDGGTATDESPKHTYTKGGTYALKLTVTGEQNQTSDTTVTVTIISAAPVAAFTVQNDNCTATCEITFTNQSQNALSYQWDFGDGGTSTEAAPKHKYTKAGSFTVKLTATGDQGKTAAVTKTVTIKDTPLPVAAFTVQNDNCTVSCEITFTNQSQNALSYQWDFGDGGTSTEAAPKHKYTKAGSFSVKLTVTGDQARTAATTKTVTIKSPPLPIATFIIQNDNCIAPCTVVLQNQSTNATTYSWKILTDYVPSKAGQICVNGNNCPVYRTTTEQSPSQLYSTAAPMVGLLSTSRLTYTAELTATGPGGTQTISKNITIREPLPVADFTFSNSGLSSKVTFTNKSTNAASYLWNFGNGATSTDENPTISYGSSGAYTVSLKVTNSTGTSEIKKVVSVSVVR